MILRLPAGVPKLRRLCLFCITVCVPVVSCYAEDPPAAKPAKPPRDILVFNNGDQLSGTLERGVGNSVVFKSDVAGEVTIKMDTIRELRSSGSFAVIRKNEPITQSTIHPGTLSLGNGTVSVAHSTEPVETVPVKETAYIIDQATYDEDLARSPKLWQAITGTASAGASLIQATQTGSNFTAAVSLVRAIPAVAYLPKTHRTTLNLSETYGVQNQPEIPRAVPPIEASTTKTSIFHADLERDEYFTPRFYSLGALSFDHNYSQGLDLQQVYGTGVGWTPIQTAVEQMDVKADIHYEKQEFETGANNLNLVGSTFAEAYRRNLPWKIVLRESASIVPAYNRPKAYSANGSLTLSVPLFRQFTMNFTATDNFLNVPSDGFRKNSFQYVTTMGYTFR